jgi:glycosyltransferase involved in cell wall biosynthesis
MNNLTNSPLVSVVIPVYKVERYIDETLKSVLAQTYTHLEIIIVDDESPDGSVEICQSYNDPRIRIIHQKNRGLAGARNTGIRHSQGKYIAFLDSDDVWLPQKIEYHVNHLESSPEVGVSFCRSAFIDDNSKPLNIYQMPKLTDITPNHIFCRNPISNGSVPVIRREVLEAIKFPDDIQGQLEDNYFDEHFHQSEDIECWIRIVLQTSWRVEGIPQALTLYRVNSMGLSASVEPQLQSWEAMVEKTRSYAPDFVTQWESLARAYQYRYLARRAVRNREGNIAVKLINQALFEDKRIITEEPQRTFMTIVAAYIINILPKKWYLTIEKIALKIIGKSQQKNIGQCNS